MSDDEVAIKDDAILLHIVLDKDGDHVDLVSTRRDTAWQIIALLGAFVIVLVHKDNIRRTNLTHPLHNMLRYGCHISLNDHNGVGITKSSEATAFLDVFV